MKKLQEKLQARAKGFTLVELIVVVIIIGILAAIAIPRMMDVRKSAQEGADEATARTIISMAATASMKYDGDLSKVGETDFLKAINDSLDVTVKNTATPANEKEWGLVYNATDKKLEVYKKYDSDIKMIYSK